MRSSTSSPSRVLPLARVPTPAARGILPPVDQRTSDAAELEQLRQDPENVGELFVHHRDRLRRMVLLRLDRRLQGRVDPSDVLQEAYLDARRRVGDYLEQPDFPPFLWLRYLTAQRLLAVHRHHLGAQMRDAARDRPLHGGPTPDATSLAGRLLGDLTSPSQAAIRTERQAQLAAILEGLEPLDREILALRHFEELSGPEAAAIIGISAPAARQRYVRALARLKDALDASPGLLP